MRWACLSLTKEEWTVEGMVEEGGVGEGRVGADLPVAAHAGVRGKHGRKNTTEQAKVLTLFHSHAVSVAP